MVAADPDDVEQRPRKPFVTAPVEVQSVEVLPVEEVGEGRVRVTFFVVVRDARGAPAPDLAVEARITGPERDGVGLGNTDEHGQVRFRMTGPRGRYRLDLLDIGAGGIDVVRDADELVTTRAVTV